ncbi:MAG: hypothetical protein OJF60_000736 [Burkholderiaceae bacterium]|jgi:hypothetical protein|nr:MAG: hypothetical protein OJF60_000736 [Burkholderiaceae bacterium]
MTESLPQSGRTFTFVCFDTKKRPADGALAPVFAPAVKYQEKR